MRTITMNEIKKMNIESWSRKDNSVRGVCTVCSSELQVGDEVVLDNYFTEIIEG